MSRIGLESALDRQRTTKNPPVYEGPTSIAVDRPLVEVFVDPTDPKTGTEIVHTAFLPVDYFHKDGEIPEHFPVQLRKKQVARMLKRDPVWLGGPTLDEALERAQRPSGYAKAFKDKAAAPEKADPEPKVEDKGSKKTSSKSVFGG